MLKFILISICSYLLGVISLIVFSIMKTSSNCSRTEENQKNWFKFGQDVYQEIEKNEKDKKK